MFEGFRAAVRRCGNIDISYVIGGDGPPVLLLHGFPQNKAMWAHVAPKLARSHTVVCADLRGYGDSGKPVELPDLSNYSFRAMAADQVELMHALGFERFHIIGHDRGGRTGHRMALDHPDRVASLAVLDIVPTHTMFAGVSRQVAKAYWHWYFLSQPAPFPETMIGHDPDRFFETCLVGWGATRIEDFDAAQVAEYRRCWRQPDAIRGACSDYRAAATVDFELDTADLACKVACPALAFWGSTGVMGNLFDMQAVWQEKCENLSTASLPGGHFFVDQYPGQSAAILGDWLQRSRL
jgi:haloacetate dehalogenase